MIEYLTVLNPGDELFPSGARRRRKVARKRRTSRKSSSAGTSRKVNPRRRRRRAASSRKASPTRRRRRRSTAARSAPVRRSNPKRRRRRAKSLSVRINPRKRRRSRASITLRANPRRHRRRRRNPGIRDTLKGYVGTLKDVLRMGAVAVPVLALQNAIGNFEVTHKDAAGIESKIPLRAKIGPLFDVGASALFLWAIPKFVLKGPLAKFRTPGIYGLSALLLVNSLRALVYYARRGWKGDAPELQPGTDAYPGWTDLVSFPEPRAAMKGLPWGQPMAQYPYGTGIEMMYAPDQGGYVPVFQQAA